MPSKIRGRSLTTRSVSEPRHRALMRTRSAFARTFLRDPNVLGLAIGYRRKDSQITPDLSLRFYVSQKRSTRQLTGDMIPPRLPLIRADGTPHPSAHVGTDIHETGWIRRAAAPLSGDEVVVSGEAGTAGLVFLNTTDGAGYLLTAGHVLDPDGSGTQQPIEIESDPAVLAQHPILLPLRRRDWSITADSSNLDAGVCRVGLPPGTSARTHDGKIVQLLEDPQYDGPYQMYSRKLARTVTASKPDLHATVKIDQVGPNSDWVYLTNAMVLPMQVVKGDSGSLLYRLLPNGEVAAVGVLVAITADDRAVFHPIRTILASFQRSENLELRLGVPGDI
jgi:hypothetical protein